MRPRARSRSPGLPADLRGRLERARLDTLALVRALDQAWVLPPPAAQPLFALDADCAEALWALDQPAGTIDVRAMLRDSLRSLEALPAARERVRQRLPRSAAALVRTLEPAIRVNLDPNEAYNDVPGRDPQNR